MEEIQYAIANGNMDAVKEYYSSKSGLTGDGLYLDDAILLATVHKQPSVVDVLLKMKYERPEDVIANASVSFICRHPRIEWSSSVMCTVLARGNATNDGLSILGVLERFTADEYAKTIIDAPNAWLDTLVDGYASRFKRSREHVDRLVVMSVKRSNVFIVVVREMLHVMSIGMLRSVSKIIGNKRVSPELLRDVLSCRDYGKWHGATLYVYAKMNKWDAEYVDIIRSR